MEYSLGTDEGFLYQPIALALLVCYLESQGSLHTVVKRREINAGKKA